MSALWGWALVYAVPVAFGVWMVAEFLAGLPG